MQRSNNRPNNPNSLSPSAREGATLSARHALNCVTYRVSTEDVIARERAKLGLPVENRLRAWNGPQEILVTATSEADAWAKALDLYPPTEGYRVESIRAVEPG